MNIAFFFTYGYSLKTWKESGVLDRELKILEFLTSRYGYKFTLDETYCFIFLKCFSDSGADDGMVSERLSKCLNLEDCGHVVIRSILDGKGPI